jgi:hypothetical protein
MFIAGEGGASAHVDPFPRRVRTSRLAERVGRRRVLLVGVVGVGLNECRTDVRGVFASDCSGRIFDQAPF